MDCSAVLTLESRGEDSRGGILAFPQKGAEKKEEKYETF